MSLLYFPSFKYPEGDLRKNPEFMDSNHHLQQQNYHNSGLMRFRSAPSSFLASLMDGDAAAAGGSGGYEDFRYLRPSSPEMETLFSKYVLSCNGSSDSGCQDLQKFGEKSMKQEETESVPQQNGYSRDSQMMYRSLPVNTLPNGNSFSVMNSMAMENSAEAKMGSGNDSNLVRQNSSPAGLFSNLGVDNGFAGMRDVGSFRACNGSNGEASPSTSRLSSHMNFSSGPSSRSRLMPQIAEVENERMGASSPEDESLGDGNGSNGHYIPNFSNDSWNDNALNGLKRVTDNDGNMFSGLSALDAQNGNSGNRPTGLTHHLSLPSPSTKMASIEKILHFQGSVPCKIRAKRGCATHPRSIAERVRRTRISERMRKLQEMFPNMDKQTNTADMLDLAVEYIKDLQKQVKTLTDTKAKCSCSK